MKSSATFGTAKMFDDFMDEDSIEDDGDSVAGAPSAPTLAPPRGNTELSGHADIENIILSLFNAGRLPHALIFAGPAGIGKATAAFRIARFLFKHGQGDAGQDSLFGDAPPAPETLYVSADDPVSHRVASGGHPDLRYFERPMDEKRGVRKGGVDIESIRKIAPFLRMSSSEGGWRVVIVDEADTMRRDAQNALLKILEEPPPKALLILICNRLGAMIPTIRSRCRTFHFSPLDAQTLGTLARRAAPDVSAADLSLLSLLADGSIGRALTLHEEEGINTLRTILAFLESFPAWEWAKIHPMAENLSRPDSERAYRSFALIMEWLCQGFLRARATGAETLPETLRSDTLSSLQNHYSLEQWIEICEKLKEHFTSIEVSNLDKRHGVLGAFAILGGQTA